MQKPKGEHDGHRERLRQRFLKEGLDGFAPHEVVEMILFYAIPRQNTNVLAHKLIDRFGSLSSLLDAPYAELLEVKGIGENAATLLKLLPELCRRYTSERASVEQIINSAESAGRLLVPRFHGLSRETVMMLCIDAKGKALGIATLAEGDVRAAQVGIRQGVGVALSFNASAVVLAHNHTSGIAVPSYEDVSMTMRLREALAVVDVVLVDHIVVAEGDFVSLAESGLIRDDANRLVGWSRYF